MERREMVHRIEGTQTPSAGDIILQINHPQCIVEFIKMMDTTYPGYHQLPTSPGLGLEQHPNGDDIFSSFVSDEVCMMNFLVHGYEYIGEWRSGRADGKGVFTWPTGAYYDGEFAHGEMEGFGVFSGTDGDYYEGDWKGSLYDGYGKRKYANGDYYDGDWKRNLHDGYGKKYYANGDYYVGDWKRNLHDGDGKKYYANGDDYDGLWKRNKQDGFGKYMWRNGNEFNGQWKNGVMSGCIPCTSTNDDDDDDGSSTTPVPINSNKFRGRILGSGGFGSVYEGFSSDGSFFAVKQVSLPEQGEEGNHEERRIHHLQQEIELLSHLEHENIVQYLGTYKDDSKLYIFLELTQGSIVSIYRQYPIDDSQASTYTRQILLGLKYLHDKNVIHRDIKCANVLVTANGTAKLADFGLAKVTRLSDVKSCKGTPFWMAPEVVCSQNLGYGLPADIWSLGCTVLEMLTRKIPYHGLEWQRALFRIGKGELPHIPDSLSRDARDFIHQCLSVNPDRRPTAAKLLEHPFPRRSLDTPSV